MNTAALRAALLSGKRRPRSPGGGSPLNFRGDGYEFAELRQYIGGDDPRRIDWAATARAGVLQSRVVLEDVALTLGAILDDSGSMGVGKKRPLTQAAHEAMRAWYACALAEDRCARITSSGLLAPLGLRGLRSALACGHATSAATPDISRAATIALAALPRGTALLLISDFHDAPSNADVYRELAARFDCTALIAADPWAAGLPLRGFVRMRDAETGATRTLFLSSKSAARFQGAAGERVRTLQENFAAIGWRTGILKEADGARSLLSAFGLA